MYSYRHFVKITRNAITKFKFKFRRVKSGVSLASNDLARAELEL